MIIRENNTRIEQFNRTMHEKNTKQEINRYMYTIILLCMHFLL